MIKKGLILSLFLLGIGLGFLFARRENFSLKSLNPQEIHQKIIQERDGAIQKAVEAGDYRCCINPPCTMCYLEANQWNNFTPGTCACDDLIAQGKEPCPQCQKGLCEKDSAGTCKTNSEANE